MSSVPPGGLSAPATSERDEWLANVQTYTTMRQKDWAWLVDVPNHELLRTNRKAKRQRCKTRRRARLRAARGDNAPDLWIAQELIKAAPRVVLGFDAAQAIEAIECAELALRKLR